MEPMDIKFRALIRELQWSMVPYLLCGKVVQKNHYGTKKVTQKFYYETKKQDKGIQSSQTAHYLVPAFTVTGTVCIHTVFITRPGLGLAHPVFRW